MNHSIKPFILQSILLWAEANQCTPLLIIKPHASHQLPDEVADVERALFNISNQAVEERVLSTQGISFWTYMNTGTHPVPIELGVEGWIGVKIKETGVIFDLGFYEELGEMVHPWPYGLALVHEADMLDERACERALEEREEHRRAQKRPHLRLVVNNDAPLPSDSQAPVVLTPIPSAPSSITPMDTRHI